METSISRRLDSGAISSEKIVCTWCEKEISNTNRCQFCGGYQLSDGPPPETPRFIPAIYQKKILYTKNINTILGIVFAIVFFWTVILGIVGILLYRKGVKDARNKLLALENGIPVSGRIVSVTVNKNVRINHKHPLKIEYEFETPNGTQFATGQAWNYDIYANYQPGTTVWVVYMPGQPEINALWPPLS